MIAAQIPSGVRVPEANEGCQVAEAEQGWQLGCGISGSVGYAAQKILDAPDHLG